MADQKITDLAGLAQIADSKLAQRVYRDGLQKGTTELGELLGELSKTTRIVLQPMFTALQGASVRLNNWVAQAVGEVPPERLVEAKPALLRATVAAIGAEDDESEMRGYYVKLLASMMDRERQQHVHPAFPRLLQDLSPLDARLLQIAPQGTEVSLPDGLEKPPYRFSSGLLATWETWKEGDLGVGRYRFFRQVEKQRPEAIGKAVFIGKGSDHAGFLEIVLPQEQLFRDRGVAWSNLERLGLASWHDEKDTRGTLKEHFWKEPETSGHMKSLLLGPSLFPGAHMYFRTELGQAFARCCVPLYTGETTWHPFQEPPKPQGATSAPGACSAEVSPL